MHVAIVEDLPPVANGIARMLREILEDRLGSLRIFHDLDDAIDHFSTHPVDLVLLDLNLGGRDGFKVLEQAVAGSFHTVIISANTHRALEAFEYGVLDFIGKPLDRERLRKALGRLDGSRAEIARPPRLLAVRGRDGIRLIPVDDVEYIQGAGKYSELHLAAGTVALHDKSLDRLGCLFEPRFRRIHKSFLVNMSHVLALSVRAGGRYAVTLRSGAELPVGRTRYRELRQQIP